MEWLCEKWPQITFIVWVLVFLYMRMPDKNVGLQDQRNINGLEDALYSDVFYIRIKVTTDGLVVFLNHF